MSMERIRADIKMAQTPCINNEVNKMANFLITIIASIFLVMGILSMPTPIPGGTMMISGSLTALIYSSPTTRRFLKYGRTRFVTINRSFYFMERTIGAKIKLIGNALYRTRPDADLTEQANID